MNKKTWWKIGVLIGIIVLVLTIDLVSKYVLDAKYYGDSLKVVVPHLFDIKLVHNPGAAWGILAGKQAFLIFLAIIFVAIFVWYYIKERNKTWLLTISVGLLLSGAAGNLYDRIVCGYVRDFILFDFWQNFPVFNFADVALVIGLVLFAVYLIVYFTKNRKKSNPEEKNGEKE